MHRQEGNAKLTGPYSGTCFLSQGWAMCLHCYRVFQKTLKHDSQISQKSHFEIRHYAVKAVVVTRG